MVTSVISTIQNQEGGEEREEKKKLIKIVSMGRQFLVLKPIYPYLILWCHIFSIFSNS